MSEHDPQFAAWEVERPDTFLKHATIATSQYDAQYRSMAAEILALRESRRRTEGLVGRIETMVANALAKHGKE